MSITTAVGTVLADYIANARAASEAMRLAESELKRRQMLIDHYREKSYAHERLIGRLRELMNDERYDDAANLITIEFHEIHGPSDNDDRAFPFASNE